MMGVALRLFDGLTESGEDRTRARLIAEAFEQLEGRYLDLKEMATQAHVRESELRLQKEVEGVRLEIREVELRLQKEIEGVRLEIRETEGRLQKEIKGVEVRLVQMMHRQTFMLAGLFAGLIAVMRALDWLAR